MKKKTLLLLASSLFLMVGCGKLENSGGKVTPQKTTKENTVTTGKIDESSYQALMVDGQYKTSASRKMMASRMNSNYNLVNVDRGLLELAKEEFSTKNYYLQEGQFLTTNLLSDWLGRETDKNKVGLNPKDTKKPLVLQQIIEKNFMDTSSQKLSGMSIGIAVNSVDYSGETPVEISDKELEEAGKKIAAIIIPRIRKLEGIDKKLPIQVGLFKQAASNDVAGGYYFAKALSKSGDNLSDWETVNESHIVLPVQGNEKNAATEDGISVKYADFKKNVQGFFPNLSGFSGIAYYRDDQLQNLTIQIETKYYSTSELESFTQFVGNSVASIFNVEGAVSVQINQLNNTKAVVLKPAKESAVTVQMFE